VKANKKKVEFEPPVVLAAADARVSAAENPAAALLKEKKIASCVGLELSNPESCSSVILECIRQTLALKSAEYKSLMKAVTSAKVMILFRSWLRASHFFL
jgi:hypothetical protein